MFIQCSDKGVPDTPPARGKEHEPEPAAKPDCCPPAREALSCLTLRVVVRRFRAWCRPEISPCGEASDRPECRSPVRLRARARLRPIRYNGARLFPAPFP